MRYLILRFKMGLCLLFILFSSMTIKEYLMAQQPVFETSRTSSIAWSENGNRIALGLYDLAATEWRIENVRFSIVQSSTGQIQMSLAIDEHVSIDGLWWRANDTELVVIYGNRIERYNTQSGVRLSQWTRPYSLVYRLGSHPDRATVALLTERGSPSRDYYLEVVDVVTGAQRSSLVLPIPYSQAVDWVGWSPDGSRLAILSGTGKALIYGWNGSTLSFQREFTYALPEYYTWGAWSPNSQQLAITIDSSGNPPGLSVYDVNTGTFLRQLTNIRIEHIQWSPETNLIAGIVWNNLGPNYVRIFDSTTGVTVQDFTRLPVGIYSFAWSKNGTLVFGYDVEYEEWLQNPNSPLVTTQRLNILP